MSPTPRTSSIADQAPTSTSKNNSTDDVQVTGEKRKAESSTTTTEEAGGKDLVETKQTTLDDVIQHERKESESVPSKPDPSTSGENDGGRVAKKSKIDNSNDNDTGSDSKTKNGTKMGEGKEEGAMTPPSQLSQTEEVLDRPHKSVKRVDNLADKPVTSTPTKSVTRAARDADAEPSSSSPLKPSTDPDTDNLPTNGASSTDGAKGAGSAEDESETVPGDEEHLDHPENWTTGDEPATEKQKGYLKVLESQKGISMGDLNGIGKSEASEKIDQLVGGDTNGVSAPTTTSASAPAAAAASAPTTEATDAIKTDGETTTNAASGAADAETVPGDEAHLDHPENWTTGGEPATDKQKGFLKVLEKQKGVEIGDVSSIGKSEASEKIDELKNM